MSNNNLMVWNIVVWRSQGTFSVLSLKDLSACSTTAAYRQEAMETKENESSRAQKLRETEQLWAAVHSIMAMVEPKQYQRNLCFLGRLFSSPLRRYIFHRASTKRGRSIFYHKGLWTRSHMYTGQRAHEAAQLSPHLVGVLQAQAQQKCP